MAIARGICRSKLGDRSDSTGHINAVEALICKVILSVNSSRKIASRSLVMGWIDGKRFAAALDMCRHDGGRFCSLLRR